MAYNSDNSDYKEYLSSLENQIKKETENVGAKKGRIKSKSHRYKVLKVNMRVFFTFVVAAAVVIGTIGIATAVKKGKSKKYISDNSYQSSDKVENTVTFPVAQYAKTNDDTVELGTEVDAKSAIIIDVANNTVIADKQSDKKCYPSSTTKIMTLLVAIDLIKNFDDTFVMTRDITDKLYVEEASVAGFLPDEVITITDMLYGTILPSGADAAVGLAIKLCGSEEAFVEQMNLKAKQLGLKSTNFVNVSGLFDENHYTSAQDMAVILHTAMLNDTCKKILSTYQYTTSKTLQHPDGIVLSSTLFSYMYGTEPETATIDGGKTGFVNESGYCIASFGHNNLNNNEYIIVTMGGTSRWPAFYGQIDLYKKYAK